MTRRTSALLTLPAIVSIAALALTGCSGGGKKGAEIEEGPLSKYMSALWEGEDFTQEYYDEQQKKTEELVAECMQKEGFEYVPDVNNGGVMISDDEEDSGPQWGSEEFAKEFGYGITTNPWGDQMPEPGSEEEYVDPNGDYVASLSESEQQAFYETLYGAGPTEEQMAEMEESGSYTSDWTQEGCQGAARHQIEQEDGGANAAYNDPEFADLFEAMNTMYDEVWGENKGDEVSKLDKQWVDCMSEKGFTDYVSSDDANMQINDEVNAVYEKIWGDGSEEISEAQATELQKQAEKEVAKFTDHEIEVATADWECKDKIGYDDKVQKLTFDIEQKFVDEHKAELDALLAKYATKKK